MQRYSITVAVPAYNEAENIEKVLQDAFREVRALTGDYEVLVVNDGSSDKTLAILKKLQTKYSPLKIIHHPYNLGIEASLKDLYNHSRKELTFTNGADNEIRMSILPELVKKIEQGADIVVARRKVKKYNLFRLFVSWGYNFLIQFLFGFNPYDAGCAKVVKTPIFKNLEVRSKSVFGEAERLIRAQRRGYKIDFVLVTHYPNLNQPGNISYSQAYQSLVDALRLKFWDRV